MLSYYSEHPDDPEALQWIAVAASNGVVQTHRSPAELTISAANKKQPAAMARLGLAYLQGDHVAQDTQGGLDLLQESLEAGEPSAALDLGRAFLMGAGVERDYEKAEGYLQQAVAMDHIRAHFLLYRLFKAKGDHDRALKELKTSAKLGDDAGMYELGIAYQGGLRNLERNPREAMQWLQQAAGRNNIPAQREVAKAIMLGYAGSLPTKRNQETARDLLHNAVRANDKEAMRLLARLYLSGELDTEFQPGEAVNLLERSSEMDDPVSMFDLGVLYVEGLVVERNLDKAKQLMQQSLEAGYEPAQNYLRRLDYRLSKTDKTPNITRDFHTTSPATH